MATKNWLGGTDNWATAADWSGGTIPGSSDDVAIATGAPFILGSVPKVHSITDDAGLDIVNTNFQVTDGLTVTGTFNVDATSGDGDSLVQIGGALTNGGKVTIGNSALGNFDEVIVDSIVNQNTEQNGNVVVEGDIYVDGNTAAGSTHQSALIVGTAAGFGTAGHVVGTVGVYGDGLIRFSSGQITTIDDISSLIVEGAQARIADYGSESSNSALLGLASNKGDLVVFDGATVTTQGGLTNTGTISLDTIGPGAGATRLTLGGMLTNSGRVLVGNGALVGYDIVQATGLYNAGGAIGMSGSVNHRAALFITSAAGFGATGHLRGAVDLGDHSVIRFASGQITTIDSGSSLVLESGDAVVADQSDTSTNSALTGLTSNAGTLLIENGAAISLAGNLVNTGLLTVTNPGTSPSAGLVVLGTLTNQGALTVNNGVSNYGTGLYAANLDNTGTIHLTHLASGSAFPVTMVVAGQFYGSGGVVHMDGNVQANFDGPVAAGQTIAISGTLNRFELAAPETFGAAITGFSYSNSFTLDEVAQGLSYANSTLSVVFKNSSIHQYSLTGTFSGLMGTVSSGKSNVTPTSPLVNLTTYTDFVNYLSGTNTVNATAATLTAADSLHGGSGSDTLALSGGGAFNLGGLAGFSGFESVSVADAGNYSITVSDADTAAGKTLFVTAAALTGTSKLSFNGSAETDGKFVVTGGAGADHITTGAGIDVLQGGAGADVLKGGGGSDFYLVDDAADKVFEAAGGGNDTVEASVDYTLAAGQEIETLETTSALGTAAIDLTGNAIANTLIGNAGADHLDGAGGADRMYGYGGNDYFYVDNAADQVLETPGNGNDRVLTSVDYTLSAGQEIETMQTTDTAATTAIDLTGNAFANTVYGNNGDNVIDGKGGNDALYGHGGHDTFVFSTTPDTATNDPTVADFHVSGTSSDMIDLSHAIYSALPTGALAASAFEVGSVATTAAQHVIYNSATGALLYDADGSGSGGGVGVQFAKLSTGLALTAGQFQVTA